MMRTAIAFGPYNVIIMHSITDRVTRAKSDTQEFRNKRLCSNILWGIYKEGYIELLKYEITVAVRRYLACLRAMFENW